MKIRCYLLFTVILVMAFSAVKPAYAEEAAEGNAAGFSVMKIDPPTPQVNKESSFYDLLVVPGEEVTIEAQITNSELEEAAYAMKATTAFTNSNGEISYTREPKGQELDASLAYQFSKLAKLSDQSPVSVPAGTHKIVSMKIKVPQNASDGVILGAWYFEKNVADTVKKQTSGISIDNRFAYALAVKLTVNKELSRPHLNLVKAEPDLNNYQKVINAQVQNDQAAVVSNLSFTGKVTKKGSSAPLYQASMADRIMAPNSNFSVPIFLKDGQLESGSYTLHLTATTKDAKWAAKTWSWTQDFVISKSQAERLNQKAINDPQPQKDYFLPVLLGIIILLLVLLLLILLFRKDKKTTKRE